MSSSETTFPPGMKEKINFMQRRHNWLTMPVAFLFGIVLISFILFLHRGPQDGNVFLVLVYTMGALTIAYMRWVRGHEIRLCKEMGLVCPHCSAPLYVLGRSVSPAGQCPKCHQTITTNPI